MAGVSFVVDETGQITGYTTETGGADTVFPFKGSEKVIGDLVFKQYQSGGELNETLTIDVKSMLPNYEKLKNENFRYEITQISPTKLTNIGNLSLDGEHYVQCRMPQLTYDNSTGTVSVLGGWLKMQGSKGYTRYIAFREIRVIYIG